jgi:hypothetical protein
METLLNNTAEYRVCQSSDYKMITLLEIRLMYHLPSVNPYVGVKCGLHGEIEQLPPDPSPNNEKTDPFRSALQSSWRLFGLSSPSTCL